MKQTLGIFMLVLLLASLSLGLADSVAAAEDGIVRVDMVSQDPEPVRAGEVVEVRFKIENLWADTKDNIRIEVIPEYPFSLYGSSNVKDLGRLEGRQESSNAVFATFKLKVDPNAVDGDNKIQVNLYDGDAKTEYKDKFVVNVKNEKIALKPYVVSSNLVTSGNKGKITITLANAGGTDLKSLELQLENSKDYKLLSTSNYVYIGDLDADDTSSEDFDIYVEKGVQQVHIPIALNYRVNDKDYADKADLTLNLLTDAEAKKLGLTPSNTNTYIIIGVILIVVAFFVIRRFRKR